MIESKGKMMLPTRVVWALLALFSVALIVVTIRQEQISNNQDAARVATTCRGDNEFRAFALSDYDQAIKDGVEAVDRFRNAEPFVPEDFEGYDTFPPAARRFLADVAVKVEDRRKVNERNATDDLRRVRELAYQFAKQFPIQDCDRNGTIGDLGDFPESAELTVSSTVPPSVTPSSAPSNT